MKTKSTLFLLLAAICLAVWAPQKLSAQYNTNDIAVINNIIEQNKLEWPKELTTDGSAVPSEWTEGVAWSGTTPYEITALNLNGANLTRKLTGTLDISGLNSLEDFDCSVNSLTGLVLTSLPALSTTTLQVGAQSVALKMIWNGTEYSSDEIELNNPTLPTGFSYNSTTKKLTVADATTTTPITFSVETGNSTYPLTGTFTITYFVPVSSRITGVPLTANAGQALTLTGALQSTTPPATNTAITWSVYEDGGTNSDIPTGTNVLTAQNAGNVIVRATIAGGLATTDYKQDFAIKVNGIVPVRELSLKTTDQTDAIAVTITAGGEKQLIAAITPANATDKSVTWSSSDPTVATVVNGLVTAVAEGATTITATSNYDGTLSASCQVAVVGSKYNLGDIAVINAMIPYMRDPSSWNTYTDPTGNSEPLWSSSRIDWSAVSTNRRIIRLDLGSGLSLTAGKVDFSGLTALERLICDQNDLTELDVSALTALTWLNCERNKLTSLDLSKNSALATLVCGFNDLAELDLTGQSLITRLECNDNKLTSLDFTHLSSTIATIIIGNNKLSRIDVTGTTRTPSANGQTPTLDMVWNSVTSKYEGVIAINPKLLTNGFSYDAATGKLSVATNTNDTWTFNSGYAGDVPGATKYFTVTLNITYHQPVDQPNGVTLTSTGPVTVGIPYTLTGTVAPPAAVQDIVWSIDEGALPSSGTKAVAFISKGNILTAVTPGIVNIKATVVNGLGAGRDHTQNFEITAAYPEYNVEDIIAINDIISLYTGLTDFSIATAEDGSVAPTAPTGKITWSADADNKRITGLDISGYNLGGAFVLNGLSALTDFNCSGNVLTKLTILNTTLTTLDCSNNKLTALDLTNFSALGSFDGSGQKLTVKMEEVAGPPVTYEATISFEPVNLTNTNITYDPVALKLSSTSAGARTTDFEIVTGLLGSVLSGTLTLDYGVFVSVTSITDLPATAVTGTPLTLSGTVDPSGATNQTIVWSIVNDNGTGAVLSGTNNDILTAATAGTVNMLATITNGTAIGTNYTQAFDIEVSAPILATGVTLDYTAVRLVPPSGSQQLTATVAPANATNKNVTWSSSHAAIASVDANGLVTIAAGVTTGSATITVTTADGSSHSAICEVTVGAAIPATGVTLTPSTVTLEIGDAQQLTATVLGDDDYEATDQTVTWNNRTPAVATFDETTGVVTAVSAGATTITVTATDGTTTWSATCVVTVSAAPTTYLVTVSSAGTGATGGGNYASGATVAISAGTAPAGYTFSHWTASPSVTFANSASASTSFTMIASAVTVTANFTLVVIPPDPDPTPDPDLTAVNNAIDLVQHTTIHIPQAEANNQAATIQWVANYLSELYAQHNYGVTVSGISISTFEPAIAGTLANKNGTNGSFSFSATFSKGYASVSVSYIHGQIIATTYVMNNNESATLQPLKAVAGNGSVIVSGLFAGDDLRVYNISGQLVYSTRAYATDVRFNLARGVYIIMSGKSTVKVSVR